MSDYRSRRFRPSAGMERVVYLAAIDAEFQRELLADRLTAVKERGIELSTSDLSMLKVVPTARLLAAIEGVDLSEDNLRRRSCLRAVAVSAAALSVGRPVGGCHVVEASDLPENFKVLVQSNKEGVAFTGKTTSRMALQNSDDWVVARLSVYLKVRSTDARSTRVYLTSPSGTRVYLVHGATYPRVDRRGLEGWFGPKGHHAVDSLVTFNGEPVSGDWILSVQSDVPATLKYWSVSADLRPSMTMVGTTTYGTYGSRPGCDCSD